MIVSKNSTAHKGTLMQRRGDIALHIPSSISEALRVPEADAERVMRIELAFALYERGLLSFGKARELASLDKASFGLSLGERKIARHYGITEVGEDLNYAGNTGDS
jgi:predicted HTH domain antitoxin